MSADGAEQLSAAAQACRALAPFLFEAAAEIRKHCDPLDADLLDTAARDCVDTFEWEFDILQMAERAIARSSKHPGWETLCASRASDVRPFHCAYAHYEPVWKAAGRAYSHAHDSLSDAELDRLKAAWKAHEQRLMTIARLRDMWIETEGV